MREHYCLLGGSGYIGRAFQRELQCRGHNYTSLTRTEVDYARFDRLLAMLRELRPSFLINCAGYTGKPNVDACETARADALRANVVLVETIANACEIAKLPWGHVSSGCIYAGAKIQTSQEPIRIEKDLMAPAVRAAWQADASLLCGFREEDSPNFSFRSPPCSFYSGTKALAEELLNDRDQIYLWRMRMPFDHEDNPRNYLSKLQSYARLYDNVNSLSHRGDFARACLTLWEQRAPFGIYNITNPGWVTTRQVVERIKKAFGLKRRFEYFKDDAEFYQVALAPRSNTLLDTTKLTSAGLAMRSVEEALDDALQNWQSNTQLG